MASGITLSLIGKLLLAPRITPMHPIALSSPLSVTANTPSCEKTVRSFYDNSKKRNKRYWEYGVMIL